mmetsp:Transcript_4192/g.10055  ORF Transcript_4192/g.10055 Transcript_4192/m.10055 type:complete len:215 (-) Transcript_4192:3163-3807(-)
MSNIPPTYRYSPTVAIERTRPLMPHTLRFWCRHSESSNAPQSLPFHIATFSTSSPPALPTFPPTYITAEDIAHAYTSPTTPSPSAFHAVPLNTATFCARTSPTAVNLPPTSTELPRAPRHIATPCTCTPAAASHWLLAPSHTATPPVTTAPAVVYARVKLPATTSFSLPSGSTYADIAATLPSRPSWSGSTSLPSQPKMLLTRWPLTDAKPPPT